MDDLTTLSLDDLYKALTTAEWSPFMVWKEVSRRFAVLAEEKASLRLALEAVKHTHARDNEYLLARATAAERDRDRLREALRMIERIAVHTKTHGQDSDPRCVLCIARAALAGANGGEPDPEVVRLREALRDEITKTDIAWGAARSESSQAFYNAGKLAGLNFVAAKIDPIQPSEGGTK